MEKEIRDYDFRNPQRLTKENIFALRMIYDNFAKEISSWLSNRLREEILVEQDDPIQTNYLDFISKYQYPTILVVINQPPLEGQSIFWIKPSLAFYIIDKFLGGTGEDIEIKREITIAEKELLKKMMEGFFEGLKNAWVDVEKVDFSLSDIVTNPLSIKVLSDNDIVVKIKLMTKISEREEEICFCIPFISLESILNKLTTKPKEEEKPTSGIGNAVESISLPIVVELGKARITMGDVLKLSCGDVLRLSRKVSDGVVLNSGGKPRFIGNPGIYGGNIAVKITKVLKGDELW
ncbi:TPA: hypothetical protein DCX16_06075 [bacterium]|nr:hypothetical protein [bacterium]